MAARDDVLRRLGALVNQGQAPAEPEEPEEERAPSEAERVPSQVERAPSKDYSVVSVVMPFKADAQQVTPFTPDAQQKAAAATETTGDSVLRDGARDLVKPLVKAWITSNLAQALDESIQEAVKPLLTDWMETNLPRIVEAATNELFKPLLTGWLDRNLAPAVERSAKREIARLIGKLPNG